MTRPAIVIGLGGTGQWVLTFLKKDLLEIGGGRMPQGVKLLCFDTTSKATAETGKASKKEDEKAVRAGSVELTKDIEFIPIGENVGQLASQIAQGDHPHMQWFPAGSFLGKLPPAAFNTKEGSGQIRQMGRISLFRDLAAARNSQILSRLRAAMQSLQQDVSRNMQLEVIIVSSLAGGTGAGMLVDMALLVREQARFLVSENYVVRGFFLLPRAFTTGGVGQDRDMLARSFAAWRELDRFMIVSERFGLRQINYHEREQDLRIKIGKRAYDVSYLVDPARQGVNSLDNVAPEEGVYPAMAHCISAFLDEIAGARYTEFVATNLAGQLAQLPRGAYHSAVGSYTLKVPVYYAREKFSHQLGLDVLDRFLAPDKNDKGSVYRVSGLRNQEKGDLLNGWPAVREFMSTTAINIDGQEIPNTKLLPLIAQVRFEEGQKEARLLQQWARGGHSRVGRPIISALTDVSQDDEGKRLMAETNDELTLEIWDKLPPSRIAGDTPLLGYPRITGKMDEVRHEHYGREGIPGEKLRGLFGKALEQAKHTQMVRFQQLLAAWTVVNLNGFSDDAGVARAGKIGYVQDFYRELVATFNYFTGFLNMVRAIRNDDMKMTRRAQEAAGQAQQIYLRKRDKRCWFTFWDGFLHPEAFRAQRNYLRAEQNRIDVRKDEILLDFLAETAVEMRDYAELTLQEISSWITHLATGAPGTTSLYQAAVSSLDNVKVNHEIDKRAGKVSEVVGEHEYQQNEAHIRQTMAALVWRVHTGSGRLSIDLGIQTPSDDPDAPPRYEPFQRDGERPEQSNLNRLVEMAERPYFTLQQERPLAREIMRIYDSGEKLADSTNQKAEVLYLTSNVKMGPRINSCYVRVHSDLDEKTSNYFRAYEDQMRSLNTNITGNNLQLVDSEDRHKMTIIRTDDLMPSTDFEMFYACRDAYIKQVTDAFRPVPAAELHVFPAEINACYYEAEMPRLLRQPYKTIHPEVVALLEDRERFEMFFRAKALGFIRLNEGDGRPFWAYKLPDDPEPLYITVPKDSLEVKEQDDIFQVIHNFALEGRDQRTGVGNALRIEWSDLRSAILKTQRELGATEAAQKYRQEIDNEEGLVNWIRAEVKKRRSAVAEDENRQAVAVEYQDLADVAQVVLLRAIDSVR